MVQKTLIASRSFQPDAKGTDISARTARTRANYATPPSHATTLIQTTTAIQTMTSARLGRIEISNFLKITED
jgi:hypothetical protein